MPVTNSSTGCRLEFSDGRPTLADLVAINAAFRQIGGYIEPLDLAATPLEFAALLRSPTLSPTEIDRLLAAFAFPRKRLAEIIAACGRAPNVPGGGELRTLEAIHQCRGPNLWVVQHGADYSRFDRFHTNVADDGTHVDEVAQLLWGGEVVVRKRLPDGSVWSLFLECPQELSGWIVAHDAGTPHVGSLTSARQGTKFLVQAIGPPQWRPVYVD